jgi:aspartate/methionine/tyrosine aminotransferase
MSRAVKEALSRHGIPFVHPDAGTTLLVSIPPGACDLQFALNLQQEGVKVTPGSYFGLPGYFRLAFMNTAEPLVLKAIDRLCAFWHSYQPSD